MEIIQKRNAPNAVSSLVLGICSLAFGCIFIGLICGIVGLSLANKGMREYRSAPDIYNGYGMLNAGKILSIIGIVLSGLYLIYYLVIVLILGLSIGGLGLINTVAA
ncbi:MAG: hypothetical protein LKI53_05855 [Bacteroidales bacterium]|jgi:hypothetical protein|nr:hypothetical protein [Bacteroidales bacterium]